MKFLSWYDVYIAKSKNDFLASLIGCVIQPLCGSLLYSVENDGRSHRTC